MNNTVRIEDGKLYIDYVEVKNVDYFSASKLSDNGYYISVSFKVSEVSDD